MWKKIRIQIIDSRQLDESDYRSKNGDNVLRLWNSTLQILLPVAALAVIWGRRGLFTRFLLQFDKNCISVLCPSFKDKQRLRDWINNISNKWFFHKEPTNTTPLEFWKDGSLLCTLINTAIPGACSNPYKHRQQPPSHGQALAYKYLGIYPVFTERELNLKFLSEQQVTTLESYMNKLQKTITRASLNDFKFSSSFVAKGMGLVSGEKFRKMTFYIYLNTTTLSNEDDLVINIRAPFETYQTFSIPYLNTTNEKSYLTKKSFDYQKHFHGSFFRTLSGDLKTFPKNDVKVEPCNQIPITFSHENDRVKVDYIPQHSGIYEISIITNGFHLLGSPFPVSITENTSNIIDSLDKVYVKTIPKKIVTKIVVSEEIDFVDNQIYDDIQMIRTNANNCDVITEEDDEISDKEFTTSAESVETPNKLISPICYDHIEPEVRNVLRHYLVDGSESENSEYDESETYINSHNFARNNSKMVTYSSKTDNLSLNILSYLSHFKPDSLNSNRQNRIVAHYKDFWQNKLSQSTYSLNNYDVISCADFKEKLEFWKTRSEIDLSNKTKILKKRRSLPDIHSISFTKEDTYSIHSTKKSRTQDYVPKKAKRSIHNYFRYSLPNLLANDNNNLIQTEIDDYMEGLEFRNKFRQCLLYWERLCSNSESIDNLSSIQSTTDDTDSGFGYSVANSDLFYQNEYMYSLFADAYNSAAFKERRNYWEKISSFSYNDIEKEIKKEMCVMKKNQSELIRKKQEMLNSLRKVDFIKQFNLDNNLTDDCKSMKNYRENIKKRFRKNKEFFESLESLT